MNKSITEIDTAPPPRLEQKPKRLSEEANRAQMETSSAFPAMIVIDGHFDNKSKGVVEVMDMLKAQAVDVNSGDMKAVEGMLINQAVALQAIFTDLAVRAKRHTSLQGIQVLTQLALKAQSGSRSTLQTLADVKNHRQVAFVKQTNVAHNQQVNNGVEPPSRTGNLEAMPNKLLVENSDGSQTLDTGTKIEASRADPEVVTVGKVNRPAKSRR